MTARKSSAFAATLARCREAARLTKKALAYELRLTPQAISRWEFDERGPSAAKLGALVRYFHGVDPALGKALADSVGSPLATFGINQPQPPLVRDGAPTAPRVLPRHAADSVVCAASEATGMTLADSRSLLLAGFRRAREMGITVELVEQGLATAAEESSAAGG